MKISIAICTWNRCRLLQQTLQSLLDARLPDGVSWQVVLVDNNSTDNTKAIIESFESELPIDYVFEAKQGHSVSRNTAIANATGDYIIWTDNDVIVGDDWLVQYARAFQAHPQTAYFGGPIIPVFESGMPDWLGATWEKCKSVFAERDLGPQERSLGAGVFPYGANFAIRTDIQKQFLFDTTDGRKANSMLGDDEIAVLRRVDAQGFQGHWVPKANVKHIIPDDRATTKYIGRYFVGQGQTNIRQGKVQKSAREAFWESLRNQIKWRLKRKLAVPDEWVSHLIRANLSWGEYLGIREQTRVHVNGHSQP
jgi:glycosyltransferase involved in cell wall biosynthesis